MSGRASIDRCKKVRPGRRDRIFPCGVTVETCYENEKEKKNEIRGATANSYLKWNRLCMSDPVLTSSFSNFQISKLSLEENWKKMAINERRLALALCPSSLFSCVPLKSPPSDPRCLSGAEPLGPYAPQHIFHIPAGCETAAAHGARRVRMFSAFYDTRRRVA